MVGRLIAASSASVALRKMHTAIEPATSRGTFPADLHRMRVVMPDRWAAFLKSHFGGDLRLVTFFFNVSERQARDWLEGKNSPRAEVALYAVDRVPGALDALMGRAA